MTEAATPHRWDPLVKLTHWSIAIAVLANALFTEGGSSSHVWIGYALAGILALRLLWGLIGPVEARFRSFPPSPARAMAHVREIAAGQTTAHRSHNPLGALMVYAIWGTLLVIIGTGIGMAGLPSGRDNERPAVTAGVVAGEEAGERGISAAGEREGGEADGGEHEEGPLGEVHEVAVNLLYGLILLHIGGVVFESRRQRRNLGLAMLPGGR